MKPILIALPLLLASCASVALYSPVTGKPLAKFSGTNGTGVTVTGGGMSLSMTTMDNATSTGIVWRGINRLGATAASAGIAMMGIPGASASEVATTRVIAAAAPHAVNATSNPVPATPAPHPLFPTSP